MTIQIQREIAELKRRVERLSVWEGSSASKQYATFVIAASDTTAAGQAKADYICDGTADEVQINAALAATTTSTFRRVLLLEGTYTIAATITMVANAVLEGQGEGTLILSSANSVRFITLASNCRVANMKLSGASRTGTRGISGTSVTDVHIEDLIILTHTLYGIDFDTVDQAIIRNCMFYDNSAGMEGIYAATCSYILIADNYFDATNEAVWIDTCDSISVAGNVINQSVYGIDFSTCNWCVAAGNVVNFCSATGIQLYSGYQNTVTGNTLYACDEAIVLDTETRSTVDGNTCAGNPSTDGSNGIDVSTSDNCAIVGNTCSDFSNAGILLSSADNNLIAHNVCIGNSWSSSTNYALNNTFGIYLTSSDTNYLHGNFVRKSSPGSSFFQRNGIRIDNSACDDNFVIDNDLRSGGNQADFADSGTNTLYRSPSGETPIKDLTIATGAVTIIGMGYYDLVPETGTADDLDTISGGADGVIITIRTRDSGDTITVKDGTGNIDCAGDFAMDTQSDTMRLIYDSSLASWLELSRSNNA